MSCILVFATQFTTTGGIESHLTRFCERLSLLDVQIYFVCPDYRASQELDRRLSACCSRLIVHKSQNNPPSSLFKLLWLLRVIIALQSRSFDSLYLNGKGSLSFYVWKLLGWRSKKCVVHHHSSGESDDVNTWSLSYHNLLTHAHTVIACSKTNGFSIQSIINRPVRVIYCFSEPAKKSHHSKPACAKLAFGLIGRLIPEKGVDTILKMSNDQNLQGIHWHLWGPLDGYSIDYISSFKNVSLHPPFHGRDGLNRALDQLDAFTLFSTHKEGLPLTLLEALSAGVPWIATDRGGIKDIVINPSSTILLKNNFLYSEAVEATKELEQFIRSGNFDPNDLTQAYHERFHPDIILGQWADLLLQPAPVPATLR